MTVVSALIKYLSFKQILFPYVRIYTKDGKKNVISYELVSIIIAALTLLVLILSGIVIPLVKKKP